jgi:ankyrin repeat protein
MGCSSSIQSSVPTIGTKQDRIVNSKSLLEACRSGDIETVAILLKTITLIEINKADWTTGNTPLHLATCYDHIDIVRLLLHYGAMRNILNYEKKIPVDYASTIEMRKLFERVTNNNFTRFVNNDFNEEDNKEIEWLQSSLDATQFYMEYESGMSYSGQWNIDQTVDALCKASELENMYDLNVVWNFFEQARDKTDAKYLIRAYTIESKFNKILNQKLIERRLKKSINCNENDQMQNTMTMFNQGFALAQALMTAKHQTDNSDITDWVHRYMGTIHSLIYQPNFPFTGLTYRGMWIKKERILYYSENRLYMCNKTLTSTSKNYKIAKQSMEKSVPLAGQIAVMCTYFIDSYTSFKAIDIHTISEYPDEEEVLLFPGIPFEIRKIDMNTTMNMVEIELVPMLSNFGNVPKMFSDILN